jgi:RNA polymerase sigma factor (sigma-70 family)
MTGLDHRGDFLNTALRLLNDRKWVQRRLRPLGDLPMPQEDVVQEAYLKLHRRLQSDEPLVVDSPKSYVATVLRNVVRDAFRKAIRAEQRLRVTQLQEHAADSKQARPGDVVAAAETLQLLQDHLPLRLKGVLQEVLEGGARLDRRKVFVMRRAAQQALKEAAAG